MTTLLDEINRIKNNLATARRESKLVDELLEMAEVDATPAVLLNLAARLRAIADAKEGDWITKTFTPSTIGELRCLADAYEQMAEPPSEAEVQARLSKSLNTDDQRWLKGTIEAVVTERDAR